MILPPLVFPDQHMDGEGVYVLNKVKFVKLFLNITALRTKAIQAIFLESY